jgi:hypothetical protein
MSSTPPVPEPARRRGSRRRPTILLLMALVAASAVPLGAIKYRRDAEARETRLNLLRSELTRATYNAKWSEALLRRGYVPAERAAADRAALDRATAELEAFEGRRGAR